MSAFYAVAYKDRVELVTDGAIYEEDGTLVDVRTKVFVSEHVPMAITGRGNYGAVGIFATVILTAATCGSFDDTMANVAERLATFRDRLDGAPVNFCEMVVAGISEREGPVILYFATADIHGEFEPYTVYRMPDEFGGGNVLTDNEVAAIPSPENGLSETAVPLFEAMRAKRGPNPAKPELPEIYGIGGHVDHTVIEAGCTTFTRLHEWPDVVGEKIRPVAS